MTTIGPITLEDWNTLRLLRSSINFYISSKNPKYSRAMEKETKLYKEYLSKYNWN